MDGIKRRCPQACKSPRLSLHLGDSLESYSLSHIFPFSPLFSCTSSCTINQRINSTSIRPHHSQHLTRTSWQLYSHLNPTPPASSVVAEEDDRNAHHPLGILSDRLLQRLLHGTCRQVLLGSRQPTVFHWLCTDLLRYCCPLLWPCRWPFEPSCCCHVWCFPSVVHHRSSVVTEIARPVDFDTSVTLRMFNCVLLTLASRE
jgi:hypothetical protein